jgi:hypothetical protein
LQTSGKWGYYRLYESQISFVIHAYDDSHWVGYAFADAQPNEGELKDETPIPRDPIALIEGSIPMANPWKYFLSVLERRTGRVRAEWECIVETLDQSIKEYVRETTLLLFPQR